MKKILILTLTLILTACSPTSEESGHMSGMGPNSTIRNMHHAEIPAPYDGIQSPVEADAESIERGKEIYRINCAECHGDGGMGDGQTGEQLNTPPAFIAHTSQMMSDGYLFWRVNEGGTDIDTGMPAFKEKLEEEEIWDAINYVRALGSGEVMPAESGMGGEIYDPEFERAHHQSMIDDALAGKYITQEQADNFMLVHEALNDYMVENDIRAGAKSVDEMQPEIFAALVEIGTLTQGEVDSFNEVHQLLLDEGLMQ
ncbi:MAG: cytochrome c [Anaerolineae bacterium]|jgi:mono/diheme cytochrome c family protein|nr:cytochrome c [Anaerolineae bacterium]MBT7189772.1 cytochrome c [Anaerolineae bacterium]MBT7991147.1 cytochrome c [Anaerolineae bacterium]